MDYQPALLLLVDHRRVAWQVMCTLLMCMVPDRSAAIPKRVIPGCSRVGVDHRVMSYGYTIMSVSCAVERIELRKIEFTLAAPQQPRDRG